MPLHVPLPTAVREDLRIAAFRTKRRLIRQFTDLELWQLRALRRAYSGLRGPDVLIVGDSQMFWFGRQELVKRQLFHLIPDLLEPDLASLALYGPGYHAQMSMAFLSALANSRSRPRIVILPLSVQIATNVWQDHPEYTYQLVASQMQALNASNASLPRRLKRPDADYWEAYDRTPAPRLLKTGETAYDQLTLGDLRMLNDAPISTSSQRTARARHRMNFFYAERLEAGSPSVHRVGELAAMLKALALQSVAYVIPVNHELIRLHLGDAGVAHVTRNTGLMLEPYVQGVGRLGTVVDATFDNINSDFIDPIHLGIAGRRALAARIVAAVREHLQ